MGEAPDAGHGQQRRKGQTGQVAVRIASGQLQPNDSFRQTNARAADPDRQILPVLPQFPVRLALGMRHQRGE